MEFQFHILGIPARDELLPMLIKDSLPSSSLACGLLSPAFIGYNGRIELSYSINFFVGDQLGWCQQKEKSNWQEPRKFDCWFGADNCPGTTLEISRSHKGKWKVVRK